MIAGLIATITVLALVYVIFRAWQTSGKNSANLEHSIKSNEEKDEILEFIHKEKKYIHSMRINLSQLNRVLAAKKDKRNT